MSSSSVRGLLSFTNFDVSRPSESNGFFDSLTAFRKSDQREYHLMTLNFIADKSSQQSEVSDLFYKLKGIDHPNLAQYSGFSYQDRDDRPRPTFFCVGDIGSKTIDSLVSGGKINITEYDVRNCIRGIANAISVLHSKNLTVGLLTRKSIAVTACGDFVLRDYGCMELISEYIKRAKYTDRFYTAPELFSGRKKAVTMMTDIWAFGTLMCELLMQATLDTRMKPGDDIPEGLNCETELIDLIKACRKKDPKERPTISQIIEILSDIPSFTPEGQTMCYMSILEAKCKNGDVDAMNELGECYMDGKCGFSVDAVEGLRLYKEAADYGHAEAMSNYGVCLQEGDGAEKNLVVGFDFIKKSADHGSAIGKAQLGVCYINGHGTKPERARGMEILKEAADSGNAFAQVNYGIYLQEEKGKSELGGSYLKRAAEQDDVEGLYNYAVCYLQGDGAPDDKEMAARLFRKAAIRGHANSQIEYAKLCRSGTGVEKNVGRARCFLLLAICQGEDDAIEEYRKFAGKHIVMSEISGKINIASIIRSQSIDGDERTELLRVLDAEQDAFEEKIITRTRIITKNILVLRRFRMRKSDVRKLFGDGSEPSDQSTAKDKDQKKRRERSPARNESKQKSDDDEPKARRRRSAAEDEESKSASKEDEPTTKRKRSPANDQSEQKSDDEPKTRRRRSSTNDDESKQKKKPVPSAAPTVKILDSQSDMTPREVRKAKEIKERADAGDDASRMWYGLRLIEGRGVERDVGAGLSWIMLASDNGYGHASFKLARAYRDGIWIERNETQAMRYLELAKDQDFSEAAVEFDICKTLAKKGLPAPPFPSPRDYDNVKTVLKIADMYAESRETPLRAQEFYMRAFDMGSSNACLKIASIAAKIGKKSLYPAALEYLFRGIDKKVKGADDEIDQFIKPQIVKDDCSYRKKVIDILFCHHAFERAAGVFLAAGDTTSYQKMMTGLEQTDRTLYRRIKQKYDK